MGRSLQAAVKSGIRGGALYDALIATTAAHHDHTVLRADRRAAAVYEALGVEVVLFGGERWRVTTAVSLSASRP
jgi:predicted nucleic acid-binding protein